MRLVVGPGANYKRKEGDVLLDINPLWADVVVDLEGGKLPFEDNSFDSIECWHVLEHIESFKAYRGIIEEFYRVLKPDGIVDIKVPHKDHSSAWASCDHVRYFIDFSFNDFTVHNPTREEQGYKCKFDYDHKGVTLDNGTPCVVEVRLKKVL